MPTSPSASPTTAPDQASAVSGAADRGGKTRISGNARPAASAEKPARFRPDIQGLRALAVGLVVFYHMWPDVLPGGFVGVDVFFVISGYLIVGSLVRELTRTGTIGLLAFYGRRIRRLLPAAAAVLLATLAATMLIFPEGRWQGVARDTVASSLNVQNWNQAINSTSYAGATSAVSPLQHYWSLAVEEQFYLFIPVLLLAVAGTLRALGRKTGRTTAALAAICAVTAASFLHSVLFSASSPDLAYFFTTTRIWELGLGGILAVAAAGRNLPQRLSTAAGWLGLAMICFAAAAFSTSMAFPGWIALVPTVGAALCIAAGNTPGAGWRTASRWQSLRPVTYVGDISYSLYLWHWPVTVFGVFLLGSAPGPLAGAALIAVSVGAAALSTRFIEKPFRSFGASARVSASASAGGRHRAPRSAHRAVYVLAGVLIVVPVAASALPYLAVQQKIDALSQENDASSYPGAMAFDSANPSLVPSGLPLRPDAGAATMDQPDVNPQCLKYDPAVIDYSDCVYGDKEAQKSIVLVGDSHAGQFVSALDIAAKETGYRLYIMTRIGCPFSAEPLHSDTRVYENCAEQNVGTVQDLLEMKPDLVVTTAMRPGGYEDTLGWTWNTQADAVNGYSKLLEPLDKAGIPVGVIGDIPYPEFSAPECVVEEEDPAECAVDRSDHASQADPLLTAAGKLANGRPVDLTDYFCDETKCPSVIGNVLVYRDNHITNTFAQTLAYPLQTGLGL
ncbi:acyltransferase family protein [Arthrobacter sp. NPDC097144]|uniref:acyltransferase family protein n=1 Tax=Arthrobacter sp. NPDC097144 TaxID=3363946 RepID=UPI00380A3E1F